MKVSEIFGWVWMNNIFGKPIKVNPSTARVVVEPITLTESILLKNGFVTESDGLNWYDGEYSQEQVYINVAVRKNGNIRRIEIIRYGVRFFHDSFYCDLSVNEFQNILRICGFSKLADNFQL